MRYDTSPDLPIFTLPIMSRILKLLILPALAVALASCSSPRSGSTASNPNIQVRKAGSCIYKVKTTAYCHMEADSLRYGRGTASGNALKYGVVRSAAADWSVFPVGTIFKIIGEKCYYQVDDYGRALVGTKTIDLYRPGMAEMRAWGARNVNIEIVRWGSYAKSLDILEDRQRHAHVRMMVSNLRKKAKNGS